MSHHCSGNAFTIRRGPYRLYRSRAAALQRIDVVDGVMYGNAPDTAAGNPGLPETQDGLNWNVVAFDKTSNLTNTEINAGDMYILGKTITMNGGSLNLYADNYRTQAGAVKQTTGKLDIAEGAVLAMTNATLNAEGTIANSGTITATDANITAGTVTNNGTLDVADSTFKVDGTFSNAGNAAFYDVDLDVTNFITGVANKGQYPVIGGTSEVNIDNLSGYYALRLADGTVLKGGSSIDGACSVRLLGNATIGEASDDKIFISSFSFFISIM